MSLLSVSQALVNMLAAAYVVLTHGGWILILILGALLAFRIYMKQIQDRFVGSTEQIFLNVKVERNNEKSLRAVDSLFSQLHAVHTSFTWAEKYLEGRVNLWISFEIVSIGGKISYVIRTPKRYRHLVESAVYSQFPNAEITEIEDYMKNLKHWTPHADWDLWGTEYLQTKDYVYPMRTYRDFEHTAAEEKILDPLAGVLEAIGKMEPYELYGIQIVIRPIADGDWLPHAKEVVAELKGEPVHAESIIDKIFKPFDLLGHKSLFQVLTEKKQHKTEEGGSPLLLRLTEGEKGTIAAIEMKASKVGYEVKIRNLYIAPKDKFDGHKKTSIIGGFRAMAGVSTNNLKPDVSHTWTNYNYKIFKSLEKPFTDYMINLKKHHMLEGYVKRSMWIGQTPMILNSEELATLYHWPLITVAVPPVESIDVKKGQPPANLPIL